MEDNGFDRCIAYSSSFAKCDNTKCLDLAYCKVHSHYSNDKSNINKYLKIDNKYFSKIITNILAKISIAKFSQEKINIFDELVIILFSNTPYMVRNKPLKKVIISKLREFRQIILNGNSESKTNFEFIIRWFESDGNMVSECVDEFIIDYDNVDDN
jgi:hypothetical protein